VVLVTLSTVQQRSAAFDIQGAQPIRRRGQELNSALTGL